MSGEGSTNAIDMLDTHIPMARIAAIRIGQGPLTLEVTWAEGRRAGRTEAVDLAPIVGSYKVYRPLRHDPPLFATAKIIEDGDAVAWDGADLEMSAETIETAAEESMTPREFAAFLDRNNLTQDGAAAVLGRSRRQIANYLKHGPIPRVVALACHGYEAILSERQRRAVA
jgi:hypothetical protein